MKDDNNFFPYHLSVVFSLYGSVKVHVINEIVVFV